MRCELGFGVCWVKELRFWEIVFSWIGWKAQGDLFFFPFFSNGFHVVGQWVSCLYILAADIQYLFCLRKCAYSWSLLLKNWEDTLLGDLDGSLARTLFVCRVHGSVLDAFSSCEFCTWKFLSLCTSAQGCGFEMIGRCACAAEWECPSLCYM